MPTDELRSDASILELLGILEYEIEAICETQREEFRREYHKHASKTIAELKRRKGLDTCQNCYRTKEQV